MEILDVDMQMVRDALASSPEYVKGHFENLLSEYEKAAALAEQLTGIATERDDLKAEVDEMKAEEDVLRAELDQRDSDQDRALETVKYWFLDVMAHQRPMSDPRKILRIVEDAL